MTSPGFKTEISALKDDAKVWDQASNDTDKPKGALAPLTLDGADDVMGLGDRMGIDDTYEQARTRMEELLGQAKEYFASLADSLVAVAGNYEAREAAAAGKFQQHQGEVGGN